MDILFRPALQVVFLQELLLQLFDESILSRHLLGKLLHVILCLHECGLEVIKLLLMFLLNLIHLRSELLLSTSFLHFDSLLKVLHLFLILSLVVLDLDFQSPNLLNVVLDLCITLFDSAFVDTDLLLELVDGGLKVSDFLVVGPLHLFHLVFEPGPLLLVV